MLYFFLLGSITFYDILSLRLQRSFHLLFIAPTAVLSH